LIQANRRGWIDRGSGCHRTTGRDRRLRPSLPPENFAFLKSRVPCENVASAKATAPENVARMKSTLAPERREPELDRAGGERHEDDDDQADGERHEDDDEHADGERHAGEGDDPASEGCVRVVRRDPNRWHSSADVRAFAVDQFSRESNMFDLQDFAVMAV